MAMDALLANKRTQIAAMCSRLGVRTLYAFGSAVRNDLKSGSDVDFLVEIQSDDPLQYADRYFALKDQLQDLLQRPVDLVEAKAVRNPYFRQELERTRELIYG